MTQAPERTTIHLVPHTHWDREWYRPFQSFRMQLVDLVDRVLDMLDTQPAFAFTLDGQLATVDDYLEIRPEQEPRLRRHVESGRLAIGPWQILMDEFLVSGETIVRNLERGWARAEAFGGPMKVGYLPDMFGHVAQMPQILRRAGLADAVVWRGVPAAVDRHVFRWEAPDGSWVRTEYLPAGYGNAAHLFAAPDSMAAAAGRFLEWAEAWFGAHPVLAMYGTDHMAPVAELAGLVSRLNEVQSASEMRISTLAEYLESAPPLEADAPRWRGEMRSGARANVLMGVTSARIDVKQAAGRAETLLERYAEPLSALHLDADAWPSPFLDLAWRKVIENSAHDSICGCSVDEVVDQVLVRFAEAQQIASGLARRAAAAVAVGVPRGSLAVLNPSPSERHGLVEASLDIPDEWGEVALELPDGTRVGTQELARKEPILFETDLRGDGANEIFRRFHGREIFDHAWNGYRLDERTVTLEVDDDPDPVFLDVEALRTEVTAAMSAAPEDEWRVRIVARPRRTLATMVPVPALGWTAARPIRGAGPIDDPVHVTDGSGLSNGLLGIKLGDDGSFTLRAADGTVATGVGRIVDGGDRGDSYNHGPPASDVLVDAPVSVQVAVTAEGPVVGRVQIRRAYDWPVGLAADAATRAAQLRPHELLTELELRAGEPFVRVRVAFDNQADDHRVRFHIPLPGGAETSDAEGQFAVVTRPMHGEGGYREEPLGTYPAHGWVDAGGMAVLLRHVAEYELLAAPGARGGSELAITLIRSTGLISRNDNPYRQDPAGPQIAIPGAQMRGPWEMRFALLPHAGAWEGGGVAAAAERHRHDLLATTGLAAPDAPWPPPGAGAPILQLVGDSVVLASLRRRTDGWIEARLVNLSRSRATATLRGAITEAREADLRGVAGGRLAIDDGGVRLDLAGSEIRTIQLRRRETVQSRPDVLDAAGPRHAG